MVEDSDQPESNLCHGEIKQCQFISMSRYQIPESWWKKTMSMMNYFQIPEPWWDRHNLQGSPPHQVAVQEGPHGGRRTWGETIIGNLKIAPAFPEVANFKFVIHQNWQSRSKKLDHF